MILPLALAQFIASYAATNMNVAISAIATDLGTDVAGVQTAITLFTLTMAALMIPGSKLTDIWGRKRCFVLGLIVYGVGGILALLSFGLPQLIIGYSLLGGVGSALMIPPIYILVTVTFPDIKTRARYFGTVSGAGAMDWAEVACAARSDDIETRTIEMERPKRICTRWIPRFFLGGFAAVCAGHWDYSG